MLWSSYVNQFTVYNLRCTTLYVVHLPDPFHLVTGFQRFRNARCICNLFYQPKKQLLGLPINICKITIQLAASQQIGIEYFAVFFQIAKMPLSPYPDMYPVLPPTVSNKASNNCPAIRTTVRYFHQICTFPYSYPPFCNLEFLNFCVCCFDQQFIHSIGIPAC